ncbi:hypothetical protein BAUCODRAFT_30684 [Baudoinia panamericana UAMH 10762]|uniref:Uncharacterized protein n=1 Tax=Baudoinia panamericana (strain UAMH 10762) TaxID=717646 RepID=M2MTI3_BAUPA|nr:uncharacterized protein BAUCODRAFT_30684 [Baudoinia panamericana UAMH 10762]EMD00217.1 hypothetical protein BAUCODRAFT_30684 [Baudoinia panamericana UAMH 10762]
MRRSDVPALYPAGPLAWDCDLISILLWVDAGLNELSFDVAKFIPVLDRERLDADLDFLDKFGVHRAAGRVRKAALHFRRLPLQRVDIVRNRS